VQQLKEPSCVQLEDGEEAQMWSLPWSTRLIDFGLSKRYAADASGLNAACTIDTHSIAWMAPETFSSAQHLQARRPCSLAQPTLSQGPVHNDVSACFMACCSACVALFGR
jgi:serine/threonine protein kinase